MKSQPRKLVALGLVGAVMVGAPNIAAAETQWGSFTTQLALDSSSTQSDVAKVMFEEERMGRDLFVRLAEEWGPTKFRNISISETQHIAIMGQQLDRLGHAHPDASVSGVYAYPELQALYDGWLQRGLVSQQEAFRVGAELERRDIADLENARSATTDPELQSAYDRLIQGSQNHLAAFEGTKGATRERGTDES